MFLHLLLAVSFSAFGTVPFGMQSPFKQLPGANNPAVPMVFTDGVDSKVAGMFIAAGMLPRYLPMLTDGVDSADMWMYGFGPGATEQSVIQQAKMRYPRSAALGMPENQELMPTWTQVVAAGLTTAPTTAPIAGDSGTTQEASAVVDPVNPMFMNPEMAEEMAENLPMAAMAAGMAGAGPFAGAGGAGLPAFTPPAAGGAGLPAGAGAGMAMAAGMEEIGDGESNMRWQAATGCNLFGVTEEGQQCMRQATEAACNKCELLGCTWSGSMCSGGMMMMPSAVLQKNAPAAQEPQEEESKWTDTVDPVYTLLFGVLAGAVFGCGLGMIYSRCTSKRNPFEESMIHLDPQV